jgi:mRNA-degrading endonuclease toxin of MazEF toxin-antitoxin module
VVKRGDIWWTEHPEWGRRPAVVMTRDQAIDSLNAVFVVFVTTTIRGIQTEVELDATDGMPYECALNADHTGTLAKTFFIERITTLASEKLRAVCTVLDTATDC